MSELKCSASASSASLEVCSATAESARERKKSMTKPLARFPDHDAGQHEQQRRFHQRGDAFEFFVTVRMFFIGGFAGKANGEVGDQRRAKIDHGMACFGKNGERAGQKPDRGLGQSEPAGRQDGSECDFLFIPLHGGSASLPAVLYFTSDRRRLLARRRDIRARAARTNPRPSARRRCCRRLVPPTRCFSTRVFRAGRPTAACSMR